MKKKIISLLILIFVCICIFGDGVNAKERRFKKQDIKYTYNDSMFYVSPMYVINDGKVRYMRYDYKPDKECSVFYIDAVRGKKVKKISSFKYRDDKYDTDIFNDVKVLDNDINLTIMKRNYGKKQNIVIREYDKKGKKIFTYIDDNEKRSIGSLGLKGWDDGSNIYYTHIKLSHDANSYVFNTRCINKKSKKVKDMRSFKLDAAKSVLSRENYLKIEKGKIYVLCEKKINVYSLNGNLLYTCKLPDGERTIRIDYDYSPEIVNYLTFNDFSVCGDYVYYCNRNGIYRWNMKGRGGFTLYYNAEGDEYFGSEYGAADICVKDENTIYLMLENIDDDDIAVPTKIVKYSRG